MSHRIKEIFINSYTESSKGLERKLFKVFLIIKNHWFFKSAHFKLPSENIVNTCKVNEVLQNIEPI